MKLLIGSIEEAATLLYFLKELGYTMDGEELTTPLNPFIFVSHFGKGVEIDLDKKDFKLFPYDENNDRDLTTYSSLSQFIVKSGLTKAQVDKYLCKDDVDYYFVEKVYSQATVEGHELPDLEGEKVVINSPNIAFVGDFLFVIEDSFFSSILYPLKDFSTIEATFSEGTLKVENTSLLRVLDYLPA